MSLVRGFEKIGGSKEREENERKKSSLGRVAKTFLGYGSAGALAGTAAGVGAVAHRGKDKGAEIIHGKMTKERGLDVSWSKGFGHGTVADRLRSGYAHQSSGLGTGAHGHVMVHPSAGATIMAHELGHAHHMGRLSTSRMKMHGHLRNYAPLAGMAAGAALLSSDDEKKRKYAPAAFVAGVAPKLYQEGRASAHAVSSMRKHLGNRAALKGAAKLTAAFGSYALPTAGLVLGAHMVNKKSEKKKSE